MSWTLSLPGVEADFLKWVRCSILNLRPDPSLALLSKLKLILIRAPGTKYRSFGVAFSFVVPVADLSSKSGAFSFVAPVADLSSKSGSRRS